MAAYRITNDRREAHHFAIKAMRPAYGSATLVHVNGGDYQRRRDRASVGPIFDMIGWSGWAHDRFYFSLFVSSEQC